ncbi:anthranilate phosphoribosyltransferase [Persephonella sp.]
MIEYLKVIGIGKKGSKDLTLNQAYEAEKMILDGGATDIQTGAFWSVIRYKYASIEELKGFLKANMENNDFIETDMKPLDIAINYDGKNRTVHILPASIFIASGAGAYMSGHGAEDVPAKYGVPYFKILEFMGCKTPESKDIIIKTLEKAGFGFYHQRLFNKKLYGILPKRREFGLRTYHNTIERMLNPFRTDKVITGVSHPPYIFKYFEIGRFAGFERITVFKSLEGGVEPFPNHETKISLNDKNIVVYPEGVVKEFILRKISPEENAKICLSILKNEDRKYTNFALLTSGILLMAYGITENLDEAVSLSEESLKSGKAYEKFKIYAQITGEG